MRNLCEFLQMPIRIYKSCTITYRNFVSIYKQIYQGLRNLGDNKEQL